MDVIETLEIGHPPENPDKILRAQIAVDIPEDERPIALVQRPNVSTLLNWCKRIMPLVSRPALPASERKHGVWPVMRIGN